MVNASIKPSFLIPVQNYYYTLTLNPSTETISTDGQTSNFNVSYAPEIAGEYEIWVLCGNVALNDGKPYNMTVSPGCIFLLYTPSVPNYLSWICLDTDLSRLILVLDTSVSRQIQDK